MLLTSLKDAIIKNDIESLAGVIARCSGLSTDLRKVIDTLFEKIASTNPSERIVSYGLIIMMVKTNNFLDLEGKICVMLDRLPGSLDHVSCNEEAESIVLFIESIANSDSDVIQNRLENIASKLISTCIRILANETKINFSLSILYQLVSSPNANLIISTQSLSIRKSCINLLSNPIAYKLSANIIALTLSLDNHDNWNTSWTQYNLDLLKILQYLGISPATTLLSTSSSTTTNATYISDVSIPIGLEGILKAIYLERLFHGYSTVLVSMLKFGCAAGHVTPELVVTLQIMSYILAMNIDTSVVNDPKKSIPNENTLSVVDLLVVQAQLKSYTLEYLIALLSTPRPALLKYGSQLHRLVSLAISCKDATSKASVAELAVQATGLFAQCVPTVAARLSDRSCVTLLVDMLVKEIGHVTRSMAKVTSMQTVDLTSSSSSGSAVTDKVHDNLSATAAGTLTVLEAVDHVISCCGPLLPDNTRAAIEATIGHALSCMAKGIQPVLPADRRMRRFACEPLRSDPDLQLLVIKVATTEVMSVYKGKISGNIPLLRRAAESCLGGNTTLSSTARHALLVIESLVHPVGALLPPVPVDLLLQDALHMRDKVLQEQRELLNKRRSSSSVGGIGEEGITVTEDEDVDVDMIKEVRTDLVMSDMNNIKKRGFNDAFAEESSSPALLAKDSQDGPDERKKQGEDEVSQEPATKRVTPTAATSALFGQQFVDNSQITNKMEDDKEEVDSLPDIDVEAEPDQL